VLKKTVRHLTNEQLEGKRVLVRADFNVPLDENGAITDDTRIRAALPTIHLLLDRGARPIIMSHLGRPKGKPDAKYSLRPVAKRLEELINHRVHFIDSTNTPEAVAATNALQLKYVLLLENTRCLPGE
jgi:3-phosphoglycerate kinase